MVRNLRFFFLFGILAFGTLFSLKAQCNSFAKNVCKTQLGGFLHDGNYNATVLSEGESADLYKTFFSGQKYRLVICKVENMPRIHYKIIDQNDEVLFDNSEDNYALSWNFEVESTQQLVVHMNVLEDNPSSETKTSGCVAILFGIESNNKRR